MQILPKTEPVHAIIGDESLIITQPAGDGLRTDTIVIPISQIEAFMLGLQQVIKDGKNGQG